MKERRWLWVALFAVWAGLFLVFFVLKFDGNVFQALEIRQNILATRAAGDSSDNFVPLRSIGRYLAALPEGYAVANLLGNILPFTLLPALLKGAFRMKTRAALLVSATVVVAAEILQHACAIGAADIDDVILGLFGCALGATLCYAIFHSKQENC